MVSYLVLREGIIETGSVMDKCVQMLNKELWRLGPDGSEGKKRRERREREEPGLGWRKVKSPALDGESMRGEPWLERTGRERERKGFSPRSEWKNDERP
ncbi:hypothetical protein TNCV_3934091 [Trichonephila clavipes]|nr:hypothetical protein TNCV_3934091 [Trichonephila clavipes]